MRPLAVALALLACVLFWDTAAAQRGPEPLQAPAGAVVLVGGDASYPPYEFIDAAGNPAGFNVDLMRAVGEVMGFRVEHRLGVWSEVRAAFDRGEIDVLPMFRSPERHRVYDFTDPFTVLYLQFVVRRGDYDAYSLEQLEGREIVVQRGSLAEEHLRATAPGTRLIDVATEADALRLLAAGEHDLALVTRLGARRAIRDYALRNIAPFGSPVLSGEYVFAVAEGNSTLLGQLDRGLDIVQATGRFDEISEAWLEAPASAWRDVARYTAYAVVPLIVVVLGAVWWTWSLRRLVARRTVELTDEIAERRRAEQALRESRVWLDTLLTNSLDLIFMIDAEGKIVHVSPSVRQNLGYDPRELIGTDGFELVSPEDLPSTREALRRAGASPGVPVSLQIRLRRRDGSWRLHEIVGQALPPDAPEPGIVVNSRDVTDRHELEAQLRQAQKLEAVGQLTSGIAHDINNVLSVVLGNAQLLRESLEDAGGEQLDDVRSIEDAAKRAADMIRKLLGFSRRAELQIERLDLSRAVADMKGMVRSLMPESIDLEMETTEGPCLVMADVGAVQQVLLNLVTNARDAMPDGGTLSITVGRVALGAGDAGKRSGAREGDYVELAVRDTGVGMDDDTKRRIFDPFFTTKPQEKGTGLGMAMVYGLVRQEDGFIDVESEVGRGTTISVYLPLAQPGGEPGSEAVEQQAERVAVGGETIVLVEDEPLLRRTGQRVLERLGYSVLVAGDGEEALRLYRERGGEIDLIISDVVMPKLGGRGLFDAVRRMDKHVPFLFSTGYSDRDIEGQARLPRQAPVLRKPWTIEEIASSVREALTASPAA
ncbi:MAG: transporter substrate-binding domain-containing protein [Gemmatimonadales bacterium]